MSDTGPVSRHARGPGDEEFVSLTLRYLFDTASLQDVSELKDALTRHQECRALYVRICRLHGGLGEMLAAMKASASPAVEAPSASMGAGPPDAGSPEDTLPLPERRDPPAAVATHEPEIPGGPAAPPDKKDEKPRDETVEFVDDAGDETHY